MACLEFQKHSVMSFVWVGRDFVATVAEVVVIVVTLTHSASQAVSVVVAIADVVGAAAVVVTVVKEFEIAIVVVVAVLAEPNEIVVKLFEVFVEVAGVTIEGF